MAITHAHVVTIPDGDADVSTNEWNAPHEGGISYGEANSGETLSVAVVGDYNATLILGDEASPGYSVHLTVDQDILIENPTSVFRVDGDQIHLNATGDAEITGEVFADLTMRANGGNASIIAKGIEGFDLTGRVFLQALAPDDAEVATFTLHDAGNGYDASIIGSTVNGVFVGAEGGVYIDDRASSGDAAAEVAVASGGVRLTGKIGFGVTPIVKPTVSGSTGGNAALASLLTALADLGLIVDSTT